MKGRLGVGSIRSCLRVMLGRVRQQSTDRERKRHKERKMRNTTNHKGGNRTERSVEKGKGANRMGSTWLQPWLSGRGSKT